MDFSPGARLGPYEIVGRLGAGGMGEVYRARDERLARDVAIKVLPAGLATDEKRLRRFEKEARAASALNHPNIVTIYEIGTSDSTSWIAMEQVDGKTLRDVLISGRLPVKKALTLASQIAEGLARAHEVGIVHRDLKPENVMVTKDGLVKILDFGLAKQTTAGSGSDEASHLPTETGTSPGMIVGTVGYMSPEQAAGEPVDFRSDQFSFGSILYEMATGKRAFAKKTGIDTLSAILNENPQPVGEINPETPAPLRWTVERCLSKEPDARYGTTRDLALELSTIRTHLSDPASAPPPDKASSRRRYSLLAASLALAAAGGAAILFLAGSSASHIPLLNFRQLTFRHGYVGYARFAPDGQTIVYSASWDGQWPDDVFTTRPGSLESRTLGIRAVVLSVSSLGDMALSLLPEGTLAQAPLAGGAPRELLKKVQWADWTPDGKNLAIIRRGAGKFSLELPVGNVLYETANKIDNLHVSRDGARIAFREVVGQRIHVRGEVMILDTASRAKKPTGIFSTEFGWAPGGKELWFLENGGELRGTDLEGKKREIARLPGTFQLDDISRDGRLLLERVDVRREIRGMAPGETEQKSFSWLDSSFAAALSDDGKVLLFHESHDTVYLRKTDGSPAVPLGQGRPLALAPDGGWALVLRSGPPPRLVMLPTGAGQPKLLDTPSLESVSNGEFLPDGKRVLLSGVEPGHKPRLYVIDTDSRGLHPVSAEGVELPELPIRHVSPDGRWTLAREIGTGWRLYSLDEPGSTAPRSITGLIGSDGPVGWTADSQSLYVQGPGETAPPLFRLDLKSGQRELIRVVKPADPAGIGASTMLVTPNGEAWIYSSYRRLSELYLAEGLK